MFLKGQSNKIFDLQFFSLFEPACATDQRVKIFSILVKNSLSYSNFKSKNLTPWGMIPWQVNKNPGLGNGHLFFFLKECSVLSVLFRSL